MKSASVKQILNLFLRTETFPVAIRMISRKDKLPEQVIVPGPHWNMQITVCQALALARRHGLMIALSQNEMYCPVAGLMLGLLPAKQDILNGTHPVSFPFWVKNQNIRNKMIRTMPRLKYGSYTHVVIAPLQKADFEAHVIIVYGNPAKISRLIQASIYSSGEAVKAENVGSLACGDLITKPMLTEKCHFSMLGGGERLIAQTQDDEAAFAILLSKIEAIMEGIKRSHELGMRYPTQSYLKFTPALTEFASGIDELARYLKQN